MIPRFAKGKFYPKNKEKYAERYEENREEKARIAKEYHKFIREQD